MARLKTQKGFIQKALELADKLRFDDTNECCPLPLPQNPARTKPINYSLHLYEQVKKSETNKQTLKQLALETIHRNYPEPDWLRIFTDGSYSEATEKSGAGVSSSIFSFYTSVGTNRTAFDGEIEAIRIALDQIHAHQHKFINSVIFTDSKSAIQAISSYDPPNTPGVQECRRLYHSLMSQGKRMVLQWVPSHCGLTGNEQADALAKKGTSINGHGTGTTPYITTKTLLKRKFKNLHEIEILKRTDGKIWRDEIHTVPDGPRNEAVASFRLITGHDLLNKHLHRIGIAPDPYCSLCQQQEHMDRQHLARCPALLRAEQHERYWEARSLLRNI